MFCDKLHTHYLVFLSNQKINIRVCFSQQIKVAFNFEYPGFSIISLLLSYAEDLKYLKIKMKPDTLGVKIRSVRRTRNGEVLIKVGSDAESKPKLTSAIRKPW